MDVLMETHRHHAIIATQRLFDSFSVICACIRVEMEKKIGNSFIVARGSRLAVYVDGVIDGLSANTSFTQNLNNSL